MISLHSRPRDARNARASGNEGDRETPRVVPRTKCRGEIMVKRASGKEKGKSGGFIEEDVLLKDLQAIDSMVGKRRTGGTASGFIMTGLVQPWSEGLLLVSPRAKGEKGKKGKEKNKKK